MPLSCPKNTPTSLFCLDCPQSHWILCFPSSRSLSNGRHSLYGACPYSGKKMLKTTQVCSRSTVRKHMLQMLKLNDLLFRLFQNLEEESWWRYPYLYISLSLQLKLSDPLLWQESHQTNKPTECELTSWALVYLHLYRAPFIKLLISSFIHSHCP